MCQDRRGFAVTGITADCDGRHSGACEVLPTASQDMAPESSGPGRTGQLMVTLYMRFHQARYLIRTQGLFHVVGRPELHGLKVAAYVEALREHQDRHVPIDLDGPLDQHPALEVAASLIDNDQVKAVAVKQEGSLGIGGAGSH
jgi:hypothetical protein